MGEIVDPSNLEVMTLLQSHMAAAERREAAHVERSTDLRALIQNQGTLLAALHDRVGRVEAAAREAKDTAREASGAAHKALNAQTDLEGALLAEVGLLAANDRAQNTALTAIKAETHEQSKTLDSLAKSEATRSTREGVIYWAVTKGVPMLWAATVTLGGAIAWLATHWK